MDAVESRNRTRGATGREGWSGGTSADPAHARDCKAPHRAVDGGGGVEGEHAAEGMGLYLFPDAEAAAVRVPGLEQVERSVRMFGRPHAIFYKGKCKKDA